MNDVQPSFLRRFRRHFQGLFVLLAACCLAALATGTVDPTIRPPSNGAVSTSVAESTQPPKFTSVDRSLLVGTWQDTFLGTRTLTLNADGTARMILDLDFAGRLMYGKRLDFDMTWSVEGALVTFDILEGSPSKQAQSAMATWGSRYEYLLDCVEDHQIEMRDSDGSMNYRLRRVSDEISARSK